MIKVAVDTNIWISFLIGKALRALTQYICSRQIAIVTCNEQLRELADVFEKPKIRKHILPHQSAMFLDFLKEISQNVSLITRVDGCRDPKDNYLLSLAIDAGADYLITGDEDLLSLKFIRTIAIIKFTDFELIMEAEV